MTTIYVDGTLVGNCTGNYSITNRNCTGSDGDAYTTVSGGVAAMASGGDTLSIRAGTYHVDPGINLEKFSGGAATTIQAYGSETVTLNSDWTSTDAKNSYTIFNIGQGSTVLNITIKNLNFTGDRSQYIGSMMIGNGTGDTETSIIVVDNCTFDGVQHAHLKGAAKWWVKNCTFKNWGYNTNDHAIYNMGTYADYDSAPLFENNYFELSTQGGGGLIGSALHFYDIGAYRTVRYNIINVTESNVLETCIFHYFPHIRYYNNVFRNPGGIGILDGGRVDPDSYMDVQNNIFIGSTINTSAVANYIIKYNITDKANLNAFIPYNATMVAPYEISNIQYATDPLIYGTTNWYDFSLQSSSPAINTGIDLGTANQNALNPNNTTWPPTTLNQNSYGAWEIGAFVYGIGGIPLEIELIH